MLKVTFEWMGDEMPAGGTMWNLLGLDAIMSQLQAIDSKLTTILVNQAAGKELIMAEQEEIANLVSQVTANRDVAQSAALAIQGMLDRIAEQNRQLQEALANSTDVSPQIKAAAEALSATTAALADAVPHISHAIVAGTKAA